MKYVLFTYRDPSVQLDPEQRSAVPTAVAAWCEEMDARGVRLEGHHAVCRGPAAFEGVLRARVRVAAIDEEEGTLIF